MIKKFESFVKENHYYDDDAITTINVDQAHKALDYDLKLGDVALLITGKEDSVDSVIGYIIDNLGDNPAYKDRISRFLKIVK